MKNLNFRKGDAKTDVFGSDRMSQPAPVEKIPDKTDNS
jgi:glutamate decarboxylase